MKIKYLFYISCILYFLGCDNPFVSTPGTQGNNIVTGIYITSEGGELYSVWGNPRTSRIGTSKEKSIVFNDEEITSLPPNFELNIPYPNPFVASATVQFQIPVASLVNVWYETAYMPQSNTPLPNQSKIEREFRRVYLIKKQNMAAGVHTVQLATLINSDDEFDENGEHIPPGFYRVFFQAGSFTAYHDIYIGGQGVTPPAGLRKYLYPYLY
jgi:hypothetical protein